MKNGEKIHVTKMSDSHIKNCIEMLERNESPFAEPFITMFKKEQERRANEEVAHQYHERRKEVLKEMSMPVGRNVMDTLKKRGLMRLIDMDLAISKCVEDMEAVKDLPQRLDGIRDAVMNIYECPIVDDAVEVVRCKNCKYYEKSEVSDRMMCWRKDVDEQSVCYDFSPYDFCSYGERRSDGR